MSQFFRDCMNDEYINWGTNPIKIRHQIRTSNYGIIENQEVFDEDIESLTSPQLLEQDEIEKQGFGDFAGGEVYVMFCLFDIPLNNNNFDYRTILFNGNEYEIIKSSFFGVNKGTEREDGYYEIAFARRIENLGV